MRVRDSMTEERDTPMHILLIEDDPMIGKSLTLALNEAGMKVDWIQDGIEGQAAAESCAHDLILLDLGLPGKAGMDILKSIRWKGNDTPLLIITAKDGIDDRVEGLDLGADDYLVKPFGFRELLARVKAIMRRNGQSPSSLSNGEITLNTSSHEATYRGKTILLSSKEFSLLQMLVERPGTIFSRSQIEERIYGWGEEVESNVIDVLIHYLRKKFDNDIVRNVRGIGWMVVKP